MPPLMKSRQWVVTLALFLLLLAAGAAWFVTRDSGSYASSRDSRQEKQAVELVDERPLQTARAMTKLAASADEQRVAEEAMRLADNEVDLAFHDASREAADHPPQAKPEFRELYQHAGEVEADVKADQERVQALKKELPKANGPRQVSLQEQLDVAQAQLELDQDELDDAKEDLVRSGADPGALIQRQFEQHQAAEHNEQQPTQATASKIDYRAGNLLSQFAAWRGLRVKIAELQRARDEAARVAATLGKSHNALEKQVSSEKKKPRTAAQPSSGSPPAGADQSQAGTGAAIKALHLLSDDQKNLADLDKRIQDEQELQATYGQWIALVQLQQRAAMHGIVQSALWILLIVLCVYLVDRVVDHYIAEGPERTRLHTLRAVIRFAIQAVGLLLILLVILGAPNQMPTIIGLAGAGLTVALKDFIVAFFGWFVLMGKNGIRVGDWVEINGVAGEVIEINLLRTVLLETGNGTSTGHPTGRKVAFVNSYAIEGHFFNFTTSGQWLWDEIQLVIPPEQDPYAIMDDIQKTVAKETEASVREAEEEWKRMTSRYRVRAVSATPAVNLRSTSSGIEVHVRYVCRAHERYALRARLNQALVQLLRRKAVHEKQPASAGN
jgi:small-conductance mechanosensitive channel